MARSEMRATGRKIMGPLSFQVDAVYCRLVKKEKKRKSVCSIFGKTGTEQRGHAREDGAQLDGEHGPTV